MIIGRTFRTQNGEDIVRLMIETSNKNSNHCLYIGGDTEKRSIYHCFSATAIVLREMSGFGIYLAAEETSFEDSKKKLEGLLGVTLIGDKNA
ncbi:MAG: hypothetical protein Q7S06_00700 [Nanoarchaeota archaeon]|nr:hypothetical protein [Nanoarchaeota archaeon]